MEELSEQTTGLSQLSAGTHLLKSDSGFYWYVDLISVPGNDLPEPNRLYVKKDKSETPVIQINFDAPDFTSFANLLLLKELNDNEQNVALQLFNEAFQKYSGGKLFLHVPSCLKEKIKLVTGCAFAPHIANENSSFLERLLYLPLNITAQTRLMEVSEKNAEKLEKIQENYEIITDKKVLKNCAEKISRLLIEHATVWAGTTEKNLRCYGEVAIRRRIATEGSVCVAFRHKKEDRIDQFGRMYVAENYGYIGDVVTRREVRNQCLMTAGISKLYHLAQERITLEKLFFMGANHATCEWYRTYGAKYIKDMSPETEDLQDFMYGSIPATGLLEQYCDHLPKAEPPPLTSVIQEALPFIPDIAASIAKNIGQTLWGTKPIPEQINKPEEEQRREISVEKKTATVMPTFRS